jgi:V-type H+-transporting ATPase subunit F
MAGSGELNKTRAANYFIHDKSRLFFKSLNNFKPQLFLTDTSLSELEEAVKGFLNRDDIAIILIVQYIAELVRHIIDAWDKPLPSIIEIPSKEHAFDPSKDSILKKAQVI